MVTTRYAATVLGIDIRTVQRHIKAGNLVATRIGRDFLIEDHELARFMRERRTPGRPPRVRTKIDHPREKETTTT